MFNHSVLCFCWIDYYTFAPGSFLFSLRNNDDLGPFKAPLQSQNDLWAIYRHNSYGPCFGWGNDLCIKNNAGSTTDSYADHGNAYQPPPGYTRGEPNTTSLLAGSLFFTPSEVEVFYLN